MMRHRLIAGLAMACISSAALVASTVAQSTGSADRKTEGEQPAAKEPTSVEDMLAQCLAAVESRAHRLRQIEQRIDSKCPSQPDRNPPSHNPWRGVVEQAVRSRLGSIRGDGVCGKLSFRLEADARLVIEAQVTDRLAIERKVTELMASLLPSEMIDFSGLEAQPACLEPFAEGWLAARGPDGWRKEYWNNVPPAFKPRLPEKEECAAIGTIIERAARLPGTDERDPFWVRDPDYEYLPCTYRGGKWETVINNRGSVKALTLQPAQKSK